MIYIDLKTLELTNKIYSVNDYIMIKSRYNNSYYSKIIMDTIIIKKLPAVNNIQTNKMLMQLK